MTKEEMVNVACDEFARLRRIEEIKDDLSYLYDDYNFLCDSRADPEEINKVWYQISWLELQLDKAYGGL